MTTTNFFCPTPPQRLKRRKAPSVITVPTVITPLKHSSSSISDYTPVGKRCSNNNKTTNKNNNGWNPFFLFCNPFQACGGKENNSTVAFDDFEWLGGEEDDDGYGFDYSNNGVVLVEDEYSSISSRSSSNPSEYHDCVLGGEDDLTLKYHDCSEYDLLAVGGDDNDDDDDIFFECEKLPFASPTTRIHEGIELPDLNMIFEQIRQNSPLAKSLMMTPNNNSNDDDNHRDNNSWTILKQNNQCNTTTIQLQEVSKLDNFNKKKCPLMRWRFHMPGLTSNDANLGQDFADCFVNYHKRKQWDEHCARSEELYSVQDLHTINTHFIDTAQYGQCIRLGIGYCLSEPNLVVSAREQLMLCGIQQFPDNTFVVWAQELDTTTTSQTNAKWLPLGERVVRGTSHLFASVIVPTNYAQEHGWKYNIEYLLQIDVGGMIPAFVTTPMTLEITDKLFRFVASVLTQDK